MSTSSSTLKSKPSLVGAAEKSKSLISLFYEKQKELGPDVLNDSRFNPLLTPFELMWSFGLNAQVPVMNLTSTHKKEIFCVSANVGIIYDYCKKEMSFLRGHGNCITTASTDKSGHWIVTADNGPDNVIIIWDTLTQKSILSIFNHPKPPLKIEVVAISPNAKLLITVCVNEDETVKIFFWLWTFGRDEPDDCYQCADNIGRPKCVQFHPTHDENFMMIFEQSVLFFTFDYKKGKLTSKPTIPPFTGGFTYTDGTYVDNCHECFAGNTKGCIVVFGNTLYTQPYNEIQFNNNKTRIKSIKVSKTGVTCVTSIDQQIVVGTISGTIMFFSSRLQLLYWLAKKIVNPISSISFKIMAKKYKVEPYPMPEMDINVNDLFVADLFEECEDRSEEYDVLFQDTAPLDASLDRKLFLARDFLLCLLCFTYYFYSNLKVSYF